MNHISDKPLNYASLFNTFRNPNSGAVVLFSGEVRGSNQGKSVDRLEYEAYEPMANSMIAAILDEAVSRWCLNKAICVHRIGTVEVMECAVVVITASAHRSAAYDANRYIIDRVKHEVPIWKHEFFTDGTSEWGENCECHNE